MNYSTIFINFYNNILNINNSSILVLFDDYNNLWFSYNDILTVLGYSNLKLQKNRLALDNKYFDTYINIIKKIQQNLPKNTQPNLKMINESGLYVLLNRSNKKFAKELSEKLFAEVLPSIRKTGKFQINRNDKKEINKLTKKLKLLSVERNRTLK